PILERRRIRRVALEAAALAAWTDRSVLVKRDMSELAGQRPAAADHLPVEKQADPNPFRDGHSDDVPHMLRVTAEPELGKRARVRRVLQGDMKTGCLLELCPDVHVDPTQVGRKHQTASVVHAARKTHPHAFEDHLWMGRAKGTDSPRELSDERVRLPRCGPRCLFDKSRIDAGQPHSRSLWP